MPLSHLSRTLALPRIGKISGAHLSLCSGGNMTTRLSRFTSARHTFSADSKLGCC